MNTLRQQPSSHKSNNNNKDEELYKFKDDTRFRSIAQKLIAPLLKT